MSAMETAAPVAAAEWCDEPPCSVASRDARSCAMLRSTCVTRTSWKRTWAASIVSGTGLAGPRIICIDICETEAPAGIAKRAGSVSRAARCASVWSSISDLARDAAVVWSASVVLISDALIRDWSSEVALLFMNAGSLAGSEGSSSVYLGPLTSRPVSRVYTIAISSAAASTLLQCTTSLMRAGGMSMPFLAKKRLSCPQLSSFRVRLLPLSYECISTSAT